MNKALIFQLLLLSSILIYWFTFIPKIGLHSDEAWFGLEAIKILKTEIARPYGMNNYTGIFQSLSNSVAFDIFGINVTAVRISGIIANTTSLLSITWFLTKRVNASAALFLILLFAQSALFLCYGKIAWEVCSFNFLFLSLSIISLYHSVVKPTFSYLWHFLFLLTSLCGVYNHILFFSVIIAAFLGYMFLKLTGSTKQNKIIEKTLPILFLSACNAFFLHATMRLFIEWVWEFLGIWTFLIPIILINIQCLIYHYYSSFFKYLITPVLKLKIHLSLKIGIPLSFLVLFLYFHGHTVFQISSQLIIFLRIFSTELPRVYQILLSITALLLLTLTLYYLIRAVIKPSSDSWAILLMTYLGVFCLFTQGFSIRYFLLFFFLLFLYLSIKLSKESKLIKLLFSLVLLLNLGLVQQNLWSINKTEFRHVKATLFTINGEEETSAHFLNLSPVINYIHQNKIGKISTTESYFIGIPLQFYKQANPQIRTYPSTATVEYDYETVGTGFKLSKK